MYATLLIDLFKFLAPFLRNAELTKPTQLLYKVSHSLIVLHEYFTVFISLFYLLFTRPTNCYMFNASKSKCVVTKPSCGRNMALTRMPTSPFRIGGIEIEFVDSWPHLGHVLNKNRDDEINIEKTLNALCGQINNVLSYFGHLSPVVKLRLIKTLL